VIVISNDSDLLAPIQVVTGQLSGHTDGRSWQFFKTGVVVNE